MNGAVEQHNAPAPLATRPRQVAREPLGVEIEQYDEPGLKTVDGITGRGRAACSLAARLASWNRSSGCSIRGRLIASSSRSSRIGAVTSSGTDRPPCTS